MIRSSTLSIKHSNDIKFQRYFDLINECRRVMNIIIDQLWEQEKIKSYYSCKLFTEKTFLSTKFIQDLGVQVCGLIKGTKKSAQKLKKIPSKPRADKINLELSSGVVTLKESNNTFDYWLEIKNVYKHRHGPKSKKDKKILIPLKSHKHFDKLTNKGIRKNSIRLSKQGITIAFEIESKQNLGKEKLGLDIGLIDLWSGSNGKQAQQSDNHGHSLKSILIKLNGKKKGSKGFKQVQDHRQNFVNWSINRLNLEGVHTLILENIKNMKRGKKTSKLLTAWSYPQIFRKLESRCEELNVSILKINPRNTSRECSKCGVIDKLSRRGKKFKCQTCGFESDADLNAAENIKNRSAEGSSIPLQEIITKESRI